MDQLRVAWQTNYQQQANLEQRVIDWPEALQMVLTQNLKLRQSRTEVTNAQESVRQVFKDLIPTLNLRSGVGKNLTSLDRITPDDVTFSADSFFSIPGVVNFSARYYSARLYQIRTEAASRLSEREQTIELYRLFYNFEELRAEQERLQVQRATAEAMEQIDPFTGRLMVTELKARELANFQQAKSLQDRAADVLGSRDFWWILSTNNLPELRYDQAPLPLSDTNRVAQLQMRLLAVELEAARAQLLGMKLRYWPELNIFVTGPPIYQRNSGGDRWWDADALRMNADLFWSLDTKGQIRRLIKQTKRQQELQRERYRQETLTLMNRLIFTQGLVQSVHEQLDRVNRQLQLMAAVPPAQEFFAIQKYSFDYRALTQEQLRLRRELSDLNTLFWFVDEAAWPDSGSALPAT